MRLETLKEMVTNKTVPNSLLIFVSKPDNFLVDQYINAICEYKGLDRRSVDELPPEQVFYEEDTCLYVMSVQKLEELVERNNSIIVCEKIDKKIEYDNIVEFPQLESWQLQDYACQLMPGVKEEDARALATAIKNVYRLDNELHKISIFPVGVQQAILKDCVESGMYSDIADKTIFDFSNALFGKDYKTLSDMYKRINVFGIEPMALLAVLYNNIKNMILVSMQKYPTEENTGLKSNQIYAIKKSAQRYSRDQLLKMFDVVSKVDKKLKSGELPADEILDHLMLKILNA